MKIKMLVAFLIVISAVFAYPDLQVYNLEYSQPTGRLVATIYNQAQEPVNEKITIDFYDNGVFYGSYDYMNGLPRYSTVSVYLNYNLDQKNHTIKAAVDPDDIVYESKEVNNEKTIFLEAKKLDTTPVPINTIPSAVEMPKIEFDSAYSYIIIIIILVVLVFVYVKMLRRRPRNEKGGTRKEGKKENIGTFFDKD